VRSLENPQTFAAASRAARTRSQDYSWSQSATQLIALAESLAEDTP
jgi:hypothetical protein